MAKNHYVSVVTPESVRANYLHVYDTDKNGKYSACLMIPKTAKKTLKLLRDAFEEARVKSKVFDEIPASLPNPLHDGDGEKPNGGKYGPEYKGMYVLNVKSNKQPTLVDQQARVSMDPDLFYSGCWVRCDLTVTTFNVSGHRGLNVYLNGIQKARDDERLGGGGLGAAAFSAVSEDGDEDDII